MSAWAILPVLAPLATCAVTALLHRHEHRQRAASTLGILLLLAFALAALVHVQAHGSAAMAFGDWPLPYGIEFRLDRVGALLVLTTALIGAAALLYLASDADPAPAHPMLRPLLHGLLAGVVGAFSTADLFNLYVWFEVALICTLGLLALGQRTDQLDATFKYLALNLFGTLLLLIAVGLLYASTGQLNFAALAQSLRSLPPELSLALLTTLGLAFLFKAAAFPLFAWLPASYHTLPTPVLALCGGLLTKVGVYGVLRTFGDLFAPAAQPLLGALGWIAAATMAVGALGAAYHWDMRRILAFHIVSQVGYILLALAIGGEAGHGAALFYTVHDMIAKSNLFLIAGLMAAYGGSFDLRRIGGLMRAQPALALLFSVPALALVGIPPLSGFWAKVLVVKSALAAGHVAWAVIALAVSLLTLYSMMKLWMEGFWKAHPDARWEPVHAQPVHEQPRPHLAPAWIACLLLAGATAAIGLAPQPLIEYVTAAAIALEAR
jgi:multicomponent Na+:H+ antiporter subunit D